MRSAWASASSSAWLMKTIETPRLLSRRIRAKKWRFSSGVSAGGRLVEDDDLGIVVHGAGDLDHLPLGGAERADRCRRIDREIQRLQELLRRDIDAAQPVERLLVPR